MVTVMVKMNVYTYCLIRRDNESGIPEAISSVSAAVSAIL